MLGCVEEVTVLLRDVYLVQGRAPLYPETGSAPETGTLVVVGGLRRERFGSVPEGFLAQSLGSLEMTDPGRNYCGVAELVRVRFESDPCGLWLS